VARCSTNRVGVGGRAGAGGWISRVSASAGRPTAKRADCSGSECWIEGGLAGGWDGRRHRGHGVVAAQRDGSVVRSSGAWLVGLRGVRLAVQAKSGYWSGSISAQFRIVDGAYQRETTAANGTNIGLCGSMQTRT
jgi:hypothetical protein